MNHNRGRQKWSFPDIKGCWEILVRNLKSVEQLHLLVLKKSRSTLVTPQEPVLDLDPKIDQQLLFEDLLAPYFAFRKGVQFEPRDLQPEYRTAEAISLLNQFNELSKDSLAIGSNN